MKRSVPVEEKIYTMIPKHNKLNISLTILNNDSHKQINFIISMMLSFFFFFFFFFFAYSKLLASF